MALLTGSFNICKDCRQIVIINYYTNILWRALIKTLELTRQLFDHSRWKVFISSLHETNMKKTIYTRKENNLLVHRKSITNYYHSCSENALEQCFHYIKSNFTIEQIADKICKLHYHCAHVYIKNYSHSLVRQMLHPFFKPDYQDVSMVYYLRHYIYLLPSIWLDNHCTHLSWNHDPQQIM